MIVKAKDVLSQKSMKAYDIGSETECELVKMDPGSLLSVKRIDVVAKILYLTFKDKCPKLADDLYYESLYVVTNGTFFEPDNKEKRSYEDYKFFFSALETKIINDGFKDKYAIPVDSNGVILDGAHRLAIAYFYNIKIPIIRIPIKTRTDYGLNQFVVKKCNVDIINIIINEMIKLIPGLYIANLWPASIGHEDEVERIIKLNNINIVYKTSINLNANGAFSYIYQIYYKEPWSGDILNSFAGTNRKFEPCFPNENPLRIYILESKSLDKIINAKAKIREIYNIGNHSIHITDSVTDAITMSKLLFNKNSVFFMNYGNPLKYKDYTYKLYNFNKNKKITITGSGVMTLYGLCKGNDVDYFCEEDNSLLVDKSHNFYIDDYGISLNEALFDERCYFEYLGMHITTLDIVKKFKEYRNEAKDKIDVELINSLKDKIKGKSNGFDEIKTRIKRGYRSTLTKGQIVLIKISHKTGTYFILRDLYHRIIDSRNQ